MVVSWRPSRAESKVIGGEYKHSRVRTPVRDEPERLTEPSVSVEQRTGRFCERREATRGGKQQRMRSTRRAVMERAVVQHVGDCDGGGCCFGGAVIPLGCRKAVAAAAIDADQADLVLSCL